MPKPQHILKVRNDTDIKIDLLRNNDPSWFSIRWLRCEENGEVSQKIIALSKEEILAIAKAVIE